jgi:cysteine desulfurase/selenocysteine lyase
MEGIRKLFPLLDGGIVYLDSAASAQKPRMVLDAMRDFAAADYANVHRGLYPLAQRADTLYSEARERMAQFFNAEKGEVVWTSGTTDAINLVANSYSPEDKIIISDAEHHSNILPWQKCKLEVMPDFDPKWLRANIKGAKLLAITGQSNVLGARTPIEEMVEIAHKAGAKVLVDAAQLAAHFAIDFKNLGADFVALSSHKLYGPTGLGVLLGKNLDELKPYRLGGDMVKSVDCHSAVYMPAPEKFEAGTQPIIETQGFKAALDFMFELGLKNIEHHARDLTLYAGEKLREIKNLRIISSPDSVGIISFVIDGASNYDIGSLLGVKGVCVRVGHHCAEPLHRKLGCAGSIRASFGVYNTREDVERLHAALLESLKVLS